MDEVSDVGQPANHHTLTSGGRCAMGLGGDSGDQGESSSSSTDYSSASDSGSCSGRGQQPAPLSQPGGPCMLEDLLRTSKKPFPRACLLLSAHLQLERAHPGTKWSLISLALRTLTLCSESQIGDEKTFRRLNPGSSFPRSIWAASVDCLLARLDWTVSALKEDNLFQAHSSSLPVEERRALNACVQVWRRRARGRAEQAGYTASLDGPSLLTSLEASILCRQDERPKLVLCLRGTTVDEPELRDRLTRFAGLMEDKGSNQWSNLEVCACTPWQVQSAVHIALTLFKGFRSVTVCRHDTVSCGVGQRVVGLPPLIMKCGTLTTVDNRFFIDVVEEEASISSGDCRTILQRHLRAPSPRYPQPSRMASLSTMVSLVIRRSALDTSGLPDHLAEAVKSASLCCSCTRAMSNGRLSARQGPSHTFQKQASLAGFKVRRSVVDEAAEYVASGSAFLPPLSEAVSAAGSTIAPMSTSESGVPHHQSTQRLSRNVVVLGGPAWHFCASCAASHLRVVPESYCRCTLCDSHVSHTALRWRSLHDAASTIIDE